MKKPQKARTSMTLAPEVLAGVRKAALEESCSVSSYIERVLRDVLNLPELQHLPIDNDLND